MPDPRVGLDRDLNSDGGDPKLVKSISFMPNPHAGPACDLNSDGGDR
ncbi:hypothetical protein TIFTF001_039766 [Ficus carica]|uniref:Uncharacterized protein n=1 Tax=Ficus carica TaxID=3494 RepID=A0AA88CH33_FICCA|nr:hypothetical protein TIFTF001_039766 [Ficus carica]